MTYFGYPPKVEKIDSCMNCRWCEEIDSKEKTKHMCTNKEFVFSNDLHPLMYRCDEWREE